MRQRSLVDLGKLNKEQKQEMWANSISGSQAWMLMNEPYNLIRDKVGVERIHKSKYDFLNSNKMKAISENAMQQGTNYEHLVFEEVKGHIPNAIYEDHTLQLFLFDDNGNRLDNLIITSTPDFYVKEGSKFTLIGDIKCSTSADNEEAMKERYYYQALHNCYVSNCFEFVLCAKNEITKPLNIYKFSFSQDDFDKYENLLMTFFMNITFKSVNAYDNLYEEKQEQKIEGKEIALKPLVEYDAQGDEAITLERLFALKQQAKEIENEIKLIEEHYKENYDNAIVRFNDKVFELKAVERRGTIDYTKAIKEISDKYGFSKTEFDAYRKEATLSKTITIKQN